VYKIIILIATTVIAINLLYTMMPGGNYEKYCKYIFGLILILIFAGSFTKIDISSEVLNFNNDIPVYETRKITETVNKQTEALIAENISNMLKSHRIYIESISVCLQNDSISEVKVLYENNERTDEIISMISSYCDIDKELIMIE